MVLALQICVTLLAIQFSCVVPQYCPPDPPHPPPHHPPPPPPPPHHPPPPPPPHHPPPPPPHHPPVPPPPHHPPPPPPPPHHPPPPPPHHPPPPPPPPHHPPPPPPHHPPPPPPPPHHPPPPPPHHPPVPPPPHHPPPPPPPPHHPPPPPPHHPPSPPPPPHHPPYPPHYPPHHPPGPVPCDDPDQFPSNFSIGVGNGAYHIEGAWDQDCKGENIWDRWLHSNPGVVVDGSNGDESSDAYNHLNDDVEIFHDLAVHHYLFSISWSRILPDGCGEVNPLGIEHYKQLIQLLKDHNIEPFVVMYFGDLPQVLQDQGGFLCETFSDWFVQYATILFENFGNDVQYWITFNDPTDVCKGGYGDGTYAPGFTEGPPFNQYLCGHNLLKAHAAVYHLYDSCYRDSQKGQISISLKSDWYEPGTDCQNDRDASETKLQFQVGWWAHPLYLGDYPDIMKSRILERSLAEGLCESRLPAFTAHEIEYIKGSIDFLSITYITFTYCSQITTTVYYADSCYDDIGVEVVKCEGDATIGIRKLINWIQCNYFNPTLFVSNNGYGSCSRDCVDDERIAYIQCILRNIRAAQLEDDADIFGYTYYSYIDGFEWLDGYTYKFGLYDVEFDCPQKTRTPRKSASYFTNLCTYGYI